MPLTREELISDLRDKLLTLVDDEHSICQVAAERGIFCGGFAQWSFSELKQRYTMITRSRPRITPAELADLANRWHIARQTALGCSLSCDAEVAETGVLQTCRGWNEWSDEELLRFHTDLCAEAVEEPADRPRSSE